MGTTGALTLADQHEISEGNIVSLNSSDLAMPMKNSVESFQSLVSSITDLKADNSKTMNGLRVNAIDLQKNLSNFSQLYLRSKETGDTQALLQVMKTEINYLADYNDISSIIFFMEGYTQHGELEELPDLSEVLDFTHTNVLIAKILHNSQRKVSYGSIKKVLKPILHDINIAELLDNTLALKGQTAMKSIAYNVIRYVIEEGGSGFDGIKKNEDATDLFTTFEDLNNGVYLVDGTLIEILENILDYDHELYEDIIDRISTYNRVIAAIKRSKGNVEKKLDEYVFNNCHLSISMTTASDLKGLLDEEIEQTNLPVKVKSQYTLGVNDIQEDSEINTALLEAPEEDIDDENIVYGWEENNGEEEWNEDDGWKDDKDDIEF